MQRGFGSFEAPTWWALLAPAHVPQPILARMRAALTGVLAEPEVRAKVEEQGADVVGSMPEECGRLLPAEIERGGQVIRENSIRADS